VDSKSGPSMNLLTKKWKEQLDILNEKK